MNRLIAAIRAWNKRRLLLRALRKNPTYKMGWECAVHQVDIGLYSAEQIVNDFENRNDAFGLGMREAARSIAIDEDRFIW